MQLWTLVTVVTAVLGLRKECPGGTSQCPDSATCCQLLNKSYGCCPLENAVCCDDHIHCCPKNTKCDADLCIQSTHKNTTGMIYSVRSQEVCPGGKYVCPDASTCCESGSPGQYSCCPLDSAVCCIDKTHCCPQNTVCDLSAGRCVGKGFLFDMYDSQKKPSAPSKQNVKKMTLLKKQNVSSVVCPGGEFQCPNGYTCCKLPTGDWGCCPFPNAFCCSDHLHCCPENMKCDVTSQSCVQGTKNVSAVLNIPAVKIGPDMITCPDKTQCSDYMTCCSIGKGHFGCCFYPNAVCCSDGSHCCPENHICDLEMKICVPKKN